MFHLAKRWPLCDTPARTQQCIHSDHRFTCPACSHHGQTVCLSLWPPAQSLEHRLHSANHSLQATPNSTIHSQAPASHPPLVDLWNAGQTAPPAEAYQGEVGSYMGVAAVVEPGLAIAMADDVIGTEHSPLLEQQEEEEFKVRMTFPV